MSRILTVTMNPALDCTAEVDHVRPREKLRCSEPVVEPGGGGINVSRVLKILGCHSVPFVMAGGLTGERLHALLCEQGLLPQIYTCAEETRQSLMFYDRSGETQYRFIMPGPHVSEREWRGALRSIVQTAGTGTWVVASGSLPPGCPDDFYVQLAEALREQKSHLAVDTSGKALQAVAQAPVSVLKISDEDLAEIVPRMSDVEAAARSLYDQCRTPIVVVTLGAKGGLVISSEGVTRIPGRAVKPVSTVGAGDSVMAAFIKAIDDGKDAVTAVRHGIAAGSAAVLTPGTELIRAQDFHRILSEMDAEAG